MDEQSQRTLTRRVVLGIFIAGLLVLSYQVLQFRWHGPAFSRS
jgi:hypothetical protein